MEILSLGQSFLCWIHSHPDFLGKSYILVKTIENPDKQLQSDTQ